MLAKVHGDYDLENSGISGKKEGRRVRRHQRLMYLDSLNAHCRDNVSLTQLTIRATEDKVL